MPQDKISFHANINKAINKPTNKITFGDLIFLFYIIVLVRQYLWLIDNNLLAWIATLLISITAFYLHLIIKPRPAQNIKRPLSFWIIAICPLIFFYANRAIFPDVTFDVMHYHIFNSERPLRGLPFINGDLFPALTVNPLPDMIMGIFRHILGYRLGTVANLFIFIWLAQLLDLLLENYFKINWQRYFAILFILLNEGMLWEISTYLVDLVALPLLLTATILVLNINQPKKIAKDQNKKILIDLGYIVFLSGLSIAIKLTSIVFVIPITILLFYRLYKDSLISSNKYFANKYSTIKYLLLYLIIFIIPILPYVIFLYKETLSPIYPYYNNIFKSPYWPLQNYKDLRFGPVKLYEVIIWPILMFFYPQRTIDLAPLTAYAGHLTLGYLLSLGYLIWQRVDAEIKAISFIMLFGTILSSLAAGNNRYALYLELISGILIVYLISLLMHKCANAQLDRKKIYAILLCSIIAILGIKTIISCRYALKMEWAGRATLFYNTRQYIGEIKNLFSDYSLINKLPDNIKEQVNSAEVWISTDQGNSAIEVLLRPDIPVINTFNFFVYLKSDSAYEQFKRKVNGVSNKKMLTIITLPALKFALNNIKNSGLKIGRINAVGLPDYFSRPIPLIFMELLPPESGDIATTVQRDAYLDIYGYKEFVPNQKRVFSDSAQIKARISPIMPLPISVKAGASEIIYLKIENIGNEIWPSDINNIYAINVANYWLNKKELDKKGNRVILEDGKTPLMIDIAPGAAITLPLTITAPKDAGTYQVEVDLRQQEQFWFKDRGSPPLIFNVQVN